MCFGGGRNKDAEEGALKNREIEKMIKADEKKAAKEVKLLLLGESHIPPTSLPLVHNHFTPTSLDNVFAMSATYVWIL